MILTDFRVFQLLNIKLKFFKIMSISLMEGFQINTMEINSNIAKLNNIGLNRGLQQKNFADEKRGMPTQTYAAYPSGELLKATYVTARPSKEEIANREFIKNTSFAEDLEDYEVKALSGMLKSNNKNSKVLRDLIGLVEGGAVHKRTIYYSSKNSDINHNLAADISLINQSRETGVAIEDLIVPKYADKNEAVKNAKIGDVYNIGDEKNVFIKTDDENAKQLKFDKKTYLKLFPPVERFTAGQSNIGDCYLVSALDTLFQTPESRVKILECFEQDGKDVKAKLPNSDEVFVAKDCKLLGEKAPAEEEKIYIRKGSAEGLKILEYLYGGVRVETAIVNAKEQTYGNIDNTVIKQLWYEEDNQYYTNAKQGAKDRLAKNRAELRYLENGGNIPERAGFTREERTEYLKNKIAEDQKSIRGYNKQLKTPEPNTDEIMGKQLDRKNQLYDAIKNPENFWAKEVGRDVELDENTGVYTRSYVFFEEDESGIILDGTKEKLQTENKWYINNRALYREAGWSMEVFHSFGINAYNFATDDDSFDEKIKQGIENKTVIGANSRHMLKNEQRLTEQYNIVSGHAYGAEPYYDENGEIRITVTNPWNTTFTTDLSLEDFKKMFNSVVFVEE